MLRSPSSPAPPRTPRRVSDAKKKKAAMKKAGSKSSLKAAASAGQLSEAENVGLDANGVAEVGRPCRARWEVEGSLEAPGRPPAAHPCSKAPPRPAGTRQPHPRR